MPSVALMNGGPIVAGRVGYAAGAYDLFHIGHLNLLRNAKEHCDVLVAGVVSDEMFERAKGRRPVIPLAERAEIVRHIDYVDRVYVEEGPDKLDVWRDLRFDVFFKGDDWRGTPRGEDLERRFAEVGVEVVYFPYTTTTSSTQVRRALELLEHGAPTVSEAARGLGGPIDIAL